MNNWACEIFQNWGLTNRTPQLQDLFDSGLRELAHFKFGRKSHRFFTNVRHGEGDWWSETEDRHSYLFSHVTIHIWCQDEPSAHHNSQVHNGANVRVAICDSRSSAVQPGSARDETWVWFVWKQEIVWRMSEESDFFFQNLLKEVLKVLVQLKMRIFSDLNFYYQNINISIYYTL